MEACWKSTFSMMSKLLWEVWVDGGLLEIDFSADVSATFRDFMKTPFSCCIKFKNASCKMKS